MKQFLYLIGEPGAGKSTLLAAALAGVPASQVDAPFAHRLLAGGVGAELGAVRPTFSGTDALGMNAIDKVIPWLFHGAAPALLVAEGDRLACDRFFTAVRAAGYHLTVAQVEAGTLAAARRAARGSKQNETWVKGRRSKADTLASKWGDLSWRLRNSGEAAVAVARLVQHPVISEIRRSAGL